MPRETTQPDNCQVGFDSEVVLLAASAARLAHLGRWLRDFDILQELTWTHVASLHVHNGTLLEAIEALEDLIGAGCDELSPPHKDNPDEDCDEVADD